MKTIQRSSLAVALFAALAASQTMAADFTPASGEFSDGGNISAIAQADSARTRADVMAEATRLPASGEFNGATVAAAPDATRTRADVKSAIAAMPASGEFSGTRTEAVAASAKSREEIRAEVIQARRTGALQANGDYVAN
ncbi:hypothetical protein [Hydrogenophaga sp. 5NK40-0174]|uniref:hypothetical protein n=1 Tax=Hydrogenophaga sp. 5NK40-0174 TaxID=3127649 RepID=UPI003107388A